MVLTGITKWISNWKENDWKTSDGKAVKNRVDFEELDYLINEVGVNVTWVSRRTRHLFSASPQTY